MHSCRIALMFSLVSMRMILQTALRVKWASVASSSMKPQRRYLNRVLFDLEEVHHDIGSVVDDDAPMMVRLKADDGRSKHIRTILKLQVGDAFRCGIVNVGMTNHAVIAATASNGDAGREKDELMINLGRRMDLNCNNRPAVDIILATPRPQKLERLIPIISCLGVGSIILIDAKKVVKDYFGCHLLRNPQAMRKLLIEGLAQAEVDCILPNIHIKRNLKDLLENELDHLIGVSVNGTNTDVLKVIAHPPLESSSDNLRMSSYIQECIVKARPDVPRRIVIAVGPEGGWDRDEVAMFQRKGFQLVNIGPRILRSDIAVPVLLGVAHEYADSSSLSDDHLSDGTM